MRNQIKREAKDRLKQLLAKANVASERVGVHLQPVHYYSEVPDRRALKRDRDNWAHPIALPGVEWDLDAQLAWLDKMCSAHLHEVAGLRSYEALSSALYGPGYGPIESQVLHCVIRSEAPRRLLEVGSGLSTMISREAARANAQEGRPATEITCIEPHPSDRLAAIRDITLLPMRAQDAPDTVFDDLEAGDLLFIDSSHAVKTGSELPRLYLEVLPRLAPGVLVHIHDISLPYTYAPNVLDSLFDRQESTLLAALLIGNRHLEVLACQSALHHARQAELQQIFPDYRPRPTENGLFIAPSGHFPSSTWLISARESRS